MWEKKNGIEKREKITIINIVHHMVYSDTEHDLEEHYAKLTSLYYEEIPTKYQNVRERAQTHWESRYDWALVYRKGFVTRGHNTNNIAEAGIRIIKDLVFERINTYNLVQMFGFITETMELYFQNRLLQIAHNRPLIQKNGAQYHNAMEISVYDTDDSNIFQTSEVHKINEQLITMCYVVNTLIATCSCDKGKNGASCPHQVAVAIKRNKQANTLIPTYNKELKCLFAKVALGNEHTGDLALYSSIHEKSLNDKYSHEEGTDNNCTDTVEMIDTSEM